MASDLKIIIPVAGIGTRLRPHTHTVPKPLLPVAGKEMLAHIVDPLVDLDPEKVIFVVGYLGDRIVEFIRQNYDFNATFVEQKELLGLGFAINIGMEQMTPGRLLIVLGDTIAHTDFSEFVADGDAIGLKKVRDPRRFGIAVIENNRIVEFEEKPANPRSDLAIIGLYYFDDSRPLKRNLERLIESGKTTRGEIQLTDALDLMVRDGATFRPFEVDGWYDCGKKETILSTNRELLNKASEAADCAGSVIIPPVSISKSATIEDSIIGPHVTIMDDAVVRRAIVRNSIIGRDARVENCMLDESLIGEKARVGGKFRELNIGDSTEVQ